MNLCLQKLCFDRKKLNSRSEIPIQVLKQRELYSLSSIVAGSGTVEDHTTALSRAKSEPYFVVVLVDTSIPLTYQGKRKQFVNKSQKSTDNSNLHRLKRDIVCFSMEVHF